MARWRALLFWLLLSLSACEPQGSQAPLPPLVSPGSGQQPQPPAQPTQPAQPAQPAGPEPVEPAPPPAPVASPQAPAPTPESPVNLSFDDMLEELAQIEDMGIDYDDPMADYERRLERPRVLFEAALQQAPTVDLVVEKLIGLREVPQGLGHVRRPFLCRLLAHQQERGIDAVGGALRRLSPEEVSEIVHELPEGEAFANVVARWFRSLSSFARTTGNDATEAQRLALVEAYSARRGPPEQLRALAAEDPSARVKERAAALLR